MKKKILLTGVTGFVGSYLLVELLEKGFEVVCLIRQKNGLKPYHRLYHALGNDFSDPRRVEQMLSQIQIVQGDITTQSFGLGKDDYRALQAEVSTIFHCAALTDFSFERSHEQWQCNVHGVENVVSFALEGPQNRDLHYVSTVYVAGDSEGTFYEDELDRGQKFNNGYEQSKFLAEKVLHRYRKQAGLKVTIYRPSIIVGHSQTGKTTLFNGMYLFLRFLCLLKNRYQTNCNQGKTLIPLRVLGKPQVTKNFVPIDYVIQRIMRIFMDTKVQGKTYHLVNSNPPRLWLIKEVMEEVLGVRGIQFVDQKAFQITPPSRTENLFVKKTGSYTAYLFNEPLFDDRHTQEILSDDGRLGSFSLDRETLANLFNYAINSNWGRRENREQDLLSTESNSCAQA